MVKRTRERAVAEKVAHDTACHLVRMRESPDAELRSPCGMRIGLEVISVVDEEILRSNRRMLETTSAIEATLHATGLPIFVEIGFNLQSFGVARNSRSHRKWLKSLELVTLFASQPNGHLEEAELEKAGIQRLAWLSWRPSQTPGVGWGYSKRTKAGRTLVDLCLAKKHQKLADYKGDGFDSFWLAIDGLGAGMVEDGGFTMLCERNYETSYDRVFLMVRGAGVELAEARDVTPQRSLAGTCPSGNAKA
jgi:hypothetical protein